MSGHPSRYASRVEKLICDLFLERFSQLRENIAESEKFLPRVDFFFRKIISPSLVYIKENSHQLQLTLRSIQTLNLFL